ESREQLGNLKQKYLNVKIMTITATYWYSDIEHLQKNFHNPDQFSVSQENVLISQELQYK
ncbi:496_t:CDS:1, partial [Ambispora gerdemannii]